MHTYIATMSQIELKIYKEILREICHNFDGAEKFINNKIEEIRSLEKPSFEEVIYFVYENCIVSVLLQFKKVAVYNEIKESTSLERVCIANIFC